MNKCIKIILYMRMSLAWHRCISSTCHWRTSGISARLLWFLDLVQTKWESSCMVFLSSSLSLYRHFPAQISECLWTGEMTKIIEIIMNPSSIWWQIFLEYFTNGVHHCSFFLKTKCSTDNLGQPMFQNPSRLSSTNSTGTLTLCQSLSDALL